MCVLSIKVPIRKKSGNLFHDSHTREHVDDQFKYDTKIDLQNTGMATNFNPIPKLCSPCYRWLCFRFFFFFLQMNTVL